VCTVEPGCDASPSVTAASSTARSASPPRVFLHEQPTELFEVALGVTLAQIDGQIGDAPGVVGIAAERTGAQRGRPDRSPQGVGNAQGAAEPAPQRSPPGWCFGSASPSSARIATASA
jgi:hypothetical protein